MSAAFTLEAHKYEPGSTWRREIRAGFGSPHSAGMNVGSYDLVRILDGDGKEVVTGEGWRKENHFQDFVDYMHDKNGNPVKMIVWSGWQDEKGYNDMKSYYA